MTTRTHGGLVERALEAVGAWLRLAAASKRQAGTAQEQGHPLVEAELHSASAERYEQAAKEAERVAVACRIQAQYHRSMAGIMRGDATPADDGR